MRGKLHCSGFTLIDGGVSFQIVAVWEGIVLSKAAQSDILIWRGLREIKA